MSPSSAAKIPRTERSRRRWREAGGGLVIVLIVICVLSVIAGSLLLTNVMRYHTTYQSASWQESIVAAEAGVDIAMNELRKRVIASPSASFQQSWTTTNPSTGKPYGNFGHAFPATSTPFDLPAHDGEGNTNTRTRVYIDVPGSDSAPSNFAVVNDNSFISQLDNPKLRDPDGVDRSRWWYRIRSLGIAGVTGPARPNIDKRDNRLRQISFFNDWRTGEALSSPQAARLVEVVVKPQTNFRNALMADKTINMSDQDVLVDSYDSSKGLYSTTNQGTMGNIATNGQLINANHASVKGDAMTNNGTVQAGDKVTGQQSANFYQELTPLTTDMLNPSWAGVPSGGTVNTETAYTASLDATNPTMVRLDGINLPDGVSMTINAPTTSSTIGGITTVTTTKQPSYIKLYVQGDIATTGTSQVTVAPNVNAIVYFTGNVNLQGNGIFNDTMLARNLVLNGVQPPANADGTFPKRTITIATFQDFEGIIYAPNHDLDLALLAAAASGGGLVGGVVGGVTGVVTTITKDVQKQIDELNKKITQANGDYSKAMTNYAKDSAQKGANSPEALKDLQDAAKAQSKVSTLQQQLQSLTGALTPSQADDHARGYNGIYGGFVARSILVENKTHIHYDETLRTAGPVNHYEIVNWFEDNVSRDGTGTPEQFWWPGGVAVAK